MCSEDLGMEECVRIYERENNRKTSLESKASYLLSIEALIVSIYGGFIALSISGQIAVPKLIFDIFALFNFFVIILVAASLNNLITVLGIKRHITPIKVDDANLIEKTLTKSKIELKTDLFDRYIISIIDISAKNDDKAEFLKKASNLLIVAIFISIVSSLLLLLFKVGGL
jgi:hypothetical protein